MLAVVLKKCADTLVCTEIVTRRRAVSLSVCFMVVACLMWARSAYAETVTLRPTSTVASPRKLALRPQTVTLAPQLPPGLKKLPEDFPQPQCATITLGTNQRQRTFLIALSEMPGRDTRLRVDANADGDLTNDPVPTLQKQPYVGRDGVELAKYVGRAVVAVPYGDTTLPMPLDFVRNDPRDMALTATRDALFYTPGIAREGEAKFGERTLKIGLLDTASIGDFAGRQNAPVTGILLFVDANGSTQFDPRGEVFDTGQPFTIGGVTYEVRNTTADGTRLELVRSEKRVLEILPTPDLRIGQVAPAFTAKTLDGKSLRFPEDFRGKKVLLHFWASWCGDCQRELPALVQAYQKLRGPDWEVLSISLDMPNVAPQLKTYVKQNKMSWPQVYDGKFWDAQVAYLYGISWIPTLYLVDGDTGKILAAEQELAGDRLQTTLRRFVK